MNGICLIWSRGRLISPSLAVGDDRYLNLSSRERPTGQRAEISGEIIWFDALAPRLGALAPCLGVLFAHAQVASNSSSYHICGKEKKCVGSSEYLSVFTSFTRASFLNMLIRLLDC